jgi:hypothetical protein
VMGEAGVEYVFYRDGDHAADRSLETGVPAKCIVVAVGRWEVEEALIETARREIGRCKMEVELGCHKKKAIRG